MKDLVTEDILVFRLVKTSNCSVVKGQWEFNSGAFGNGHPSEPGGERVDMSVVLEDTLREIGRLPEDLPAEGALVGEEWGVASIAAKFLRENEQVILRTPNIPDEPAHGDVRGQKKEARRRKIKRNASWVVRPKAPAID